MVPDEVAEKRIRAGLWGEGGMVRSCGCGYPWIAVDLAKSSSRTRVGVELG